MIILITITLHPDQDGGGTMSEDECMEILYHRFGKEIMSKVSHFFFINLQPLKK